MAEITAASCVIRGFKLDCLVFAQIVLNADTQQSSAHNPQIVRSA